MTGVRLSRPVVSALSAFALAWLILLAGTPGARAQFTRFQNYTDEQGLGDLTVTAIVQDTDGFMLFGTQGGLYRFDGAAITPYDVSVGLPSAGWVAELATDKAGRVWVVTENGIYVRLRTRFKRVDAETTAFDPALSHVLAATGGEMFLALHGRLMEAPVSADGVGTMRPAFDGATLARVPNLRGVRFAVSDPLGGVLLGCGGALCRLADGQVTEMGLARGLPTDEWQVATRARDGALWVRSLSRLAVLRPGQGSFAVVDVPGQRSSFFGGHAGELALVADRHGGVLTQGNQGLLGWNATGWRAYPRHVGGLPPSVVESLMFDREGSLWAGSSGYGAFRSQGLGLWEHWTSEDGLPDNNTWAMVPVGGGRLWVATESGTVLLGANGRVAGTAGGSDYALARSRGGRLWAAPMGERLLRRGGATGAIERFAAIGTVLSSAVDRQNRLWLCTRTELYVVDNADAPAADVRPRFVVARGRMSVDADSGGTVWLLARDGVFRADAAGRLDLVVPPAALKGQPISASVSPEGDLWVATEEDGVLRFTLRDGRAVPLAPLTVPVISSNATLSLHRDDRGWMWVGTDHGIDVRDGQGWRHYDSSNGAITRDVDEWSVAEGGDGSMWFGTSHGLSHLIDPGPPATGMAAALHPRVTQVMLGSRPLRQAGEMVIPWSTSPLVIRFADPDFNLGRIGFRYRMDGLDPGWNETAGREARYAHLPAGMIRFELVAFNGRRDMSSAAVGFTLRIRAPWWQRPWFHTVCGVAAALALVAAWRVRVRLLVQHKFRLEALVGARTAEIEEAREELQTKALEEQERLAGEQRRLEEMVQQRTLEIEQARYELERLAMSDALTGLPNRRAIADRLEAAVAQARESGTGLAVLLYDLDRFKAINDGFGHLAGDTVLSTFGHKLGEAVSDLGAAGRYGGEEFLLILPGCEHELRRRVAAMQASLSGLRFDFGGAERVVTVSGGLAFLREGDTAVTLVGRADAALYRAKRGGRDQIEEEGAAAGLAGSHAGDPQEGGAAGMVTGPPADLWTADLEHELRLALAEGQFELHYQPVVNIVEDVVTSCEALLRWHSPTMGSVAPGVFIPLAEQIGLMPALGEWVLRAACREAATWPEEVRVSVNLSPLQLRRPDLTDRVAAALDEAGLPADRLELEVTETATIDDIAGATAMLMRLKRLGVTIALDDFGTGASSLSFLRTLPFDRLKIDQSFVHDLGVRSEAVPIVRAMAELCASLGRSITGEGAETQRHIDLLREVGCVEVQGYGICRPLPAAAFKGWLADFQKHRFEATPSSRVPVLMN